MAPRAVPVPDGGFRRIAVLRLSSLGDVVLTLPAVAALRAAWPEAHIDYWVKEEFADVVRHDPRVDHVRVLDRDARRLEDLVSMSAELEGRDLIVDLHGSARSRVLTFRQGAPVLRAAAYRVRRSRWVHARWSGPPPVPHALERYARALAPLGIEPRGAPEMAAGAEAEAWAAGWWAAWAPAAPPVAMLPAARHATKRWPESHWLALDAALESAGVPRLYCSLPAERDGLVALAAQAARGGARWCTEPLPRMAALLSRCDGAVGGDTGLTHVAAARGLRVVALFGSTSPVLGFAPAGAGHRVLCRREPCQPCTLHGREACPLGHFRCMTAIEAGDVLESIRSVRRPA